jgi:hypothetical protein
MRRPCCLVLAVLGVLALAAPAPSAAQEPGPPETQPPETQPEVPSAPDLVLSGRGVRLTRGGYVGILMGCRSSSAPGEACIGSLTIRLSEAIVIQVPPPPNRPRERPRTRRINPFNFGVRDFTLAVGDATKLRLRLSAAAQRLIRQQERVRADLLVRYNSRAGVPGSTKRNVRIYFAKRPEV